MQYGNMESQGCFEKELEKEHHMLYNPIFDSCLVK